jgi:aminoglycoside 3-N-acetyltransferase
VHSRQELVADLRALGVRPGDVVMAHASVRAIGEVAGGPDEIHRAIIDAASPGGTLLMYAGCPRYVDEVGRGNLSVSEEAEVLAKLPPFDAATARSARDHGVLVECFRTWPGTLVNDHPARFAASGTHASRLVDSTPWDYAFGRGSPLDRFLALDGRILLLGSDRDAVTFLHYVEHVVDFPGKRVARFKVPVLADGVRAWRDMAEFDTSGDGVHPNWPPDFFARIMDGYLSASANAGGRVGSAVSHYLPARDLFDFAAPVMKRTAAV